VAGAFGRAHESWEATMQAGDLHERVQTLMNEGDVDGLVALYEPDARMLRDDGTVAEGQAAIRDIWAGLVALGGQISMTTRYAVESGDTALLSNTWTFEVQGQSFSDTAAEVARRQADGTWLYLIDNPYAGSHQAG
jgi:ketosteroid isomerase-like protein